MRTVILLFLLFPVVGFAQPMLTGAQLDCLARNVYFEARSESIEGMAAVAHVTVNRVRDPRYPNNICDVVKQPKQFSWYKGPTSVYVNWRDPLEWRAWKEIEQFVVAFALTYSAAKDPTNGALWYHADYVQPVWADSFVVSTVIGRHIFYVEP